MVEAWINQWTSDLPTVFLCLAEQGERIYAERFRSNGELNNVLEAEIELPNVSHTLVRKKWVTVCAYVILATYDQAVTRLCGIPLLAHISLQ